MQNLSFILNQNNYKQSTIPAFARKEQSLFFKPLIQPKLTINQPNDIYEQEADAVAERIMRIPDTKTKPTFFQPKPLPTTPVQRKCAECEEEEKLQMKTKTGDNAGMVAPPIVHNVINFAGQPLDARTRNFMESRFGYDFGNVQVHNDALAHQSSADINAQAYTHGKHVVFAEGRYQPGSNSGKQLLAHELAHVVQQNSSEESFLIQGYRPKSSANFGACDTTALSEDSFSTTKDKNTKPWIEEITVDFNATIEDSDKDIIPTGTLNAGYFNNSISAITSQVAGGKASQGLTDSGSHTVRRIEGCGYHHTSVPKADRISGHSRAGKYYRDTSKATMNFAVFFVQGDRSGNQAIHKGSFNTGSLACVHVPDNNLVQQINYHSVTGLTKVKISYDSAVLQVLCCERFKATGRMVSNPCKGQSSTSCP
jgi:hypothetical protein